MRAIRRNHLIVLGLAVAILAAASFARLALPEKEASGDATTGGVPATRTADVPPEGVASRGHDEASVSAQAMPAQVRNQAIPAYKREIDSLRIQENLEQLKTKAQRDPVFAYALAMALLQCSTADAAYGALSDSAGRAYSAQQAAATETVLNRELEKCRGLKDRNLELRFDLATQAARAGVLDAQIDYRTLGAEFVLSESALRRPGAAAEFSQNVRLFTVRAASSGDPRALYNAFSLFSDGMLVKPDPVTAYRYLRKFNDAKNTSFSHRALAEYGATLTPEQLAEASR